MGISFVSPWAALVGVCALLPLLAFALGQRRVARVRRLLGLAAAAGTARLVAPGAAALVVALLALAAAQPVHSERHTSSVRSDADVIVVLDESKSMGAAKRPGGTTRFERARGAALELRSRLPGVRVGLVSLTDRVLPHLFPSADAPDFRATVADAMAIDSPPPKGRGSGTTTSLASLGSLASDAFFRPGSRTRIAVVLTDGESVPPEAGQLRARLRDAHVQLLFVQFWQAGERIFLPSGPDPRYRADPAAPASLASLAVTLGARVLPERRAARAGGVVRSLLGDGAREALPSHTTVRPLSPFLAALALVPLAFLLRRRNL